MRFAALVGQGPAASVAVLPLLCGVIWPVTVSTACRNPALPKRVYKRMMAVC